MGVLGLRHAQRAAARMLVALLLLFTCLLVLQLTHHPAPHTPTPPTAPPASNTTVLVRDLFVPGFARPHPELCPSLGSRARLVILVTSAPAHAEARETVRQTWGHAWHRTDVVIGFVIGAPPEELRDALDDEDALYGDLIEAHWVDSYSNLTLKTLSMLEWKVTYCPRAPHLLKVDDDVFVNVVRLLEIASVPVRYNARRTVFGVLRRNGTPDRNPQSKYYAPFEEYPGAVFPPYADGPAYLMTADAAQRFLLAAPMARFLRLEDVFITGVLADQCGVRRIYYPVFHNREKFIHRCVVKYVVAIHGVSYFEQFSLWRKLYESKTTCAAASVRPTIWFLYIFIHILFFLTSFLSDLWF